MKKCLIIDSYGFIFRAFHVQPNLTSPRGEPVGAIYGFTSMLIRLLSEQNPAQVVAVFDSGGKNFRHEIFPEYKSHRPEVPEELIKQFPLARKVAEVLNIKTLEQKGFEADDLIATIARQASAQGEEVIVVSSDKDLAQLLDDKIKIYDPTKFKLITQEDITEKFGVKSDRIRDVLALIGDKSDNIPGVPGFGPKTASDLINQFGSFNELCNNFQKIESPRKRQIFEENLDKAKMSYELVGLKDDIIHNLDVSNLKWDRPSGEELKQFLDEYGFKSLLARSQKITKEVQKSQNDAQVSMFPTPKVGNIQNAVSSGRVYNRDPAEGEQILKQVQDYGTANTYECNFEALSDLAFKVGYCNIMIQEKEIVASVQGKIARTLDHNLLTEIMTNDAITKIFFNVKESYKYFETINSYEDIALMAYILSSGYKQSDLRNLYIKYTSKEQTSVEEMCMNMNKLCSILRKELFNQKLLDLYLSIDLPISKILSKMEKYGVKFDIEKLNSLSKEFELLIKEQESKIFAIAGKEFNIASPKQLAEVLFEELKLPTGSKTDKTKSFSTGAEVLEELALEGFEIADFLLKWRQFSKLKNTYTDSLPKLVNPNTGRIHTTFSQVSTTTGRLSSIEPNLQNIPIKTKEGEKIRSSLVSPSGWKLISADYSQIELRILAEIANIKELQEAFVINIDVHSKTASQVFGVSLENVTSEMRRKAKAINFGIIYGISGFGLAKQLGISRSEAKDYIEKYFATYPGIKEYMEKTKKFAYENGYVENYIGRKCFLPLIHSGNNAEKSFAERAAINAPIQGSASDIAKIAMIQVDRMLSDRNLNAIMILQIHDELVFECPDSEVDILLPLIKSSMENAANFTTKLKVDIVVADHWS